MRVAINIDKILYCGIYFSIHDTWSRFRFATVKLKQFIGEVSKRIL